jgi:PAP2 superfamily
MLTWQAATLLAAVMFVVGTIMMRSGGRRRGIAGPFVREAGVVLALYALWQFAGTLSLGHVGQARARGLWIWHLQQHLHLPSEAWVQRGILGHPLLVQAANVYYAVMHFGVLTTMLVWLFWRHRDAYPWVRMTIVLTTTACLLVSLVPVAPPRLIDVGMVDTAQKYGESVYSSTGIGAAQYAAMPSVHVAWAGIVAMAVILVSTSRWRWLILLHFAATVYVVVATANHFWADGIVALALLALAVAAQTASTRIAARYRRRIRIRQRALGIVDEREDEVEAA